MSYFDNRGELNASSVKDALYTISKLATVMNDGMPSNFSLHSQPQVNESEREQLVTRALYSDEGKRALAQAMAMPIRSNLDYQGIGRRSLVVDPLTNGALPVYQKDVSPTAVVVSNNGSPPESRLFSESITANTFIIASNPTVLITELRKRRFNMIDRAVQKARQEIMAQEDANLFAALDAAASVENTLTDLADSGLLKADLIDLKTEVDKWDLVTSKFFMNIREFNDILKWGSGGGQGPTGGEVDPVTQREILQTGLFAKAWGADLMVSKIVPQGTVYACADPEFVGVMPVRSDIEVLPADEPKRLMLGWLAFEEIGIAIVNPRGVAAGRKSVSAG